MNNVLQTENLTNKKAKREKVKMKTKKNNNRLTSGAMELLKSISLKNCTVFEGMLLSNSMVPLVKF